MFQPSSQLTTGAVTPPEQSPAQVRGRGGKKNKAKETSLKNQVELRNYTKFCIQGICWIQSRLVSCQGKLGRFKEISRNCGKKIERKGINGF